MRKRAFYNSVRKPLWPSGRAALLGFLCCATALTAWGFQQPGGRDPGTPRPATAEPKPQTTNKRQVKAGRRGNSAAASSKEPTLVDLRIIAPPGCHLFLNGHEIEFQTPGAVLALNGQQINLEYSAASGSLTLKRLKADSYTVTASQPNHLDYRQSVALSPQIPNVVTVTLVPSPGALTVSPSVSDAAIDLFDLEKGVAVNRYHDRLSGIELPPGRYRVNLTKEGYEAAAREVTVRPGESVYLEPQMEPVPAPTPTPQPKRELTVIPPAASVERNGKYITVHIVGASGETSGQVGTVVVAANGTTGADISGSLTGLPCRIQFVQLENVAESSLAEAPGPSNQWARIVVRIRPKDWKRVVRFAINWSLLAGSSLLQGEVQSGTFAEALVIRQPRPVFPTTGRSSRAFASVSVEMVIDKQGSVAAAKATDDGPLLFARRLRRPPISGGFRSAVWMIRPVESLQTIRFDFEC